MVDDGTARKFLIDVNVLAHDTLWRSVRQLWNGTGICGLWVVMFWHSGLMRRRRVSPVGGYGGGKGARQIFTPQCRTIDV